MDSKRRSSWDDPGVAASSALRRLTQTPRLGLRRSGTTSSSSSSVASHDHDELTSCVTRDTSHDECTLNRFMVWAAVKRNACPRLTPSQRLECPLLRCRKPFPSHELLLQHLYSCEHLSDGEYWCYDCGRSERFSDAKCRRCLGHPSRRKRIVSMAKTFFSSLGHRSRTGSLPDLDIDVDGPPPSYHESLDDPVSLSQAELQANEIHEIDSTEVLPTIVEEDLAGEQASVSPQDLKLEIRRPLRTVRPAELETYYGQPSSQAATVAPVNLNIFGSNVQSTLPCNSERPSLQIQTVLDPAQHRTQTNKSRSLALGPSSSVRSTTSTTSTTSTNSTNSSTSTGSYAISTISSWSGGWGHVPDFDSALTTPSDEFAPNNPFRASSKPTESYTPLGCFDPASAHPDIDNQYTPKTDCCFSSELPVDMPDVGPMPSLPQAAAPSLSLPRSQFTFDLGNATTLAQEAGAQTAQAPKLESALIDAPRISAYSLTKTAWDTLQTHVSESLSRLEDVKDNDFVENFRAMPPEDVASRGLHALLVILDHSIVDTPLDLLCFVHLAYSLSLVVHEHNTPTWTTKLFAQAVSYASWLVRDDRRTYLQVVDVLWKPSDMSDDEVLGLVRKASTSAAALAKGKKSWGLRHASNEAADPMAFVSQFFLDDIELLAIQEIERRETQASELCIQHLKDTTMDPTRDVQVYMTISLLQGVLSQEYANETAFVAGLHDLCTRAQLKCGLTARWLELQLVAVGKVFLPTSTFFNSYITFLRLQVDALYSVASCQTRTRLTYHKLGAALVESIIRGTTSGTAVKSDAPKFPGELEFEDIMEVMNDGLGAFGLDTLSFNTSRFDSFPSPTPELTNGSWTTSPNTTEPRQDPLTAAISPMSQVPTPQAGTKVECGSCCDICGYRPEGDPRWFQGSMAKHKKLRHATSPPRIYQCPFPGCKSKYTNRPDNLRQHQLKKGHFVDDEGGDKQRPGKRRKVE